MSRIPTNSNKWFKRRRTEDIRSHIRCNGIILKATSQSKNPESERNSKRPGLKLTQHKRQTLLFESAPKKLKASSKENCEVVLATNISKGMMRKKARATEGQENVPHGTNITVTPTDKTSTQLTLKASSLPPLTQQQPSLVQQQQREPRQQLSVAYRQQESSSLSLVPQQQPTLASIALIQQPSIVPLIQHEHCLTSTDYGRYGCCINCIQRVDCVDKQHSPPYHCNHQCCNSSNPVAITNEAKDLTTDCRQHAGSSNITKGIQSVAADCASASAVDSIGLPDSSLEEFVPSSQLSPATILRILNCDTDQFINDLYPV